MNAPENVLKAPENDKNAAESVLAEAEWVRNAPDGGKNLPDGALGLPDGDKNVAELPICDLCVKSRAQIKVSAPSTKISVPEMRSEASLARKSAKLADMRGEKQRRGFAASQSRAGDESDFVGQLHRAAQPRLGCRKEPQMTPMDSQMNTDF